MIGLLLKIAVPIVRFLWKVGLGKIAIKLLTWVAKRQISGLVKIAKLPAREVITLLRNTYIARLKELGIPYRVFIKRAPKEFLDLLRFHRLKPNPGPLSKESLKKLEDLRTVQRLGLATPRRIGVTVFWAASTIVVGWFALTQTIDFFVWPKMFLKREKTSREWLEINEREWKRKALVEKEKAEAAEYGLPLKEIRKIYEIYRDQGYTHWLYPNTGEQISITEATTREVVRQIYFNLITEGRKKTVRADIYKLLPIFAVIIKPYEEKKRDLSPEERKEVEAAETFLPGETEEIELAAFPEVVPPVRPPVEVPVKVAKTYRFISKFVTTPAEKRDDILEAIDAHYPTAKRRLETEIGIPLKADPEIRAGKTQPEYNAVAGKKGMRITFNQDKLRSENLERFKNITLYHELVHILHLQYGINSSYSTPHHERLTENLAFYLSGEPERAEIFKRIPDFTREKAIRILQLWISFKEAGDSTGKAREKAVFEVTGKSWAEWRGLPQPAWVRKTKTKEIPPLPKPKPIEPPEVPELPPYADVVNPLSGDTLRIPKELLISGTIVRDPTTKRHLRVINKEGVIRLEPTLEPPAVDLVEKAKVPPKLPDPEKEKIIEKVKETIDTIKLKVEEIKAAFVKMVSPYTGKEILVPKGELKPGNIIIDGTSRNRVRVILEEGKWRLGKITESPVISPPPPIGVTTPEIKTELAKVAELKKEEKKVVAPVIEVKKEAERKGQLTYTPEQKKVVEEAAKKLAEIKAKIEEIKKRTAELIAKRGK